MEKQNVKKDVIALKNSLDALLVGIDTLETSQEIEELMKDLSSNARSHWESETLSSLYFQVKGYYA